MKGRQTSSLVKRLRKALIVEEVDIEFLLFSVFDEEEEEATDDSFESNSEPQSKSSSSSTSSSSSSSSTTICLKAKFFGWSSSEFSFFIFSIEAED